MPTSYSIASSAKTVEDYFNVEVTTKYEARFNGSPTKLLPVITAENPGGISFFYWGINPAFVKSKSISEKLIFAPVEDILSKASLKKNLKTQRCVILADGFYIWKNISKKERVPYRVHTVDNCPFGIAGLWDEFENENGDIVHTFMMITTKANSDISDVTERMPAILDSDLMIDWLNESNTEESVINFITPYKEKPLDRYTVSPRLDDPNYDNAELIKNVPPANQFGSFTLFG
ncbi:MAG: putative SOS response-associated peptidase YedK [Roseivirga sp.]|jgi:putative SOS response-associated peptidase YedK